MGQSQPSITRTTHTLPFDKLSAREFERLCLWLVEREGYELPEHLGAAGSEQDRDIAAWREGKLWAFQCKRVQHFGPSDAEAEVDKILGLPESQRPAELVFLVACDVSEETRRRARARCAGEMECQFWALTELDERVNRYPEIVQEFFEAAHDEGGEPGWWRRFLRRPSVSYLRKAFGVIAAIVALMAALTAIGADIGGAGEQLREWGLIRAFSPEKEDETLIVIASFYHSEGIPDTEAHGEICRAIQKTKEDLGLSNLRVEVEPTRVRADDRDGAENLGKRYDASMVIWGADTGVRVTVNYLNLKHPDFGAAEVQISETERTQLANPSAYADFITRDLPGQLTFLSLFAIGHSYYTEAAYADSFEVIEKAIDSLAPDTEPPKGLDHAYFRLGWLHQVLMDDDQQAIADYDRAIALNPDYADAYNNRGIARDHLGDLEGAIADYDRAIALNPDYADAYNNRGIARDHLGDLEGAIANYDRAIALNPDYAGAYNNRGITRKALGDLEGAIADYDRAIALNPDFAGAYNNRGIARQALGDLEGAIADYDQAIALHPDFDMAHNNRGNARQVLGDLEGAIADYDRAIALNPDSAGAYNNRGTARQALGDLEGAIADYDRAIALNPDFAGAYNNRGTARKILGDLEGAIADYDRAIALNPDFADAYNNRGTARKILGDLEGAIANYDRAIALNPDYADAYNNRGNARKALDNLEGAIADYDQAIALNPDFDMAYNNRGTLRYDLGDLESAIADFDQAIALNPKYADPYYNRGIARQALGDLEGAIADYDRAIALNPDFDMAYNNRGIARKALGNLEGAIADYDRAIALNPDFARAYCARGWAHRQLGNAKAALADFRRCLELQPDADNREAFEEWLAELEAQVPE